MDYGKPSGITEFGDATMSEHYLPIDRQTTEAIRFTDMSGEDLLVKNRELNFWMQDPTISQRQLVEVKRIQNLLVFEVQQRLIEGSLKRVMGKIALA